MHLNRNDEKNGKAIVGCFLIGLALYKLPLILLLVNGLFKLALVAGGGYTIFLIYLYEQRTMNISNFFRKLHGKPTFHTRNEYREHDNYSNYPPSQPMALPPPKDERETDLRIDLLKEQVESLRLENTRIRDSQSTEVENTIQKYVHKIDRKNKQDVLKNVFGDSVVEYSKSDAYEQEQLLKLQAKREEQLSNREFQQTMKEQLYEVRVEAKEERYAIRSEMKDGFMYLQKEVLSLREFCIKKFHFLDAKIETSIANVREIIADFKTQVGREIYRLDSNMLRVVEKLENYNNQVEKYKFQVKEAVLASEKHGLRAERLLQQSQTLAAHHAASVKVLSKDIDVAVKKMVLQNGDFANKVAGAKLTLDRQTMEMTDSLKQVAHEKMGARLLQDANAKQFQVSEMKLQRLVDERRHIEQRMQVSANNERQLSQLRHQLNMNQENLAYTRNQNSALRQEASLIRKFSK